ncbi:MAG: sulfite exporter TauE/SafE family protein [Sandaracinaceae bacterium]|nr:sulfite exporter TauE/SafE family protein [Sandaracinaceae bacterium]
MPCGALYAGLLVAAGSGTPHGGALAMLAFGLSSALGLGAVSVLATRVARGPRWLPRALAAALVAGAVLFAVRPLDGLASDAPPTDCHAPRAQVDAPLPLH